MNKILFNTQTGKWELHAEPHIRRKVRRMFDAAAESRLEYITFPNNPATCIDLEWLRQRWLFEMTPHDENLMRAFALVERERENITKQIMEGSWKTDQPPLAVPLRDYQVIGVEFAKANKGVLVGDDLGLGKTSIAIGLMASSNTLPAVVLCETHVQKQWYNEIKKFAPWLKVAIARSTMPEINDADVQIVPYSKVAGWAGYLERKTMILDEVQNLRGGKESKRYEAIFEAAAAATYRIGLSATPVYNYGGEIFHIMNVLQPGCFGTEGEFYREWCQFVGTKWRIKEPDALGSYMREAGLMIRRVRSDVGRQLPPVTLLAQAVQHKESVLKRLSGEALQLARTILQGTNLQKGQAARQFDMKLRQATGIAKAPFVADFVLDLVRGGKKVLLTGWHREVFDIWQFAFQEESVPYWMYTGSESTSRKENTVQSFVESDVPGVMIMSNRSGAGLNELQKVCSTVVIGEYDWCPNVHKQIIGRLQRDGQFSAEGVTAIFCTADAGSDPIIARILGVKMEQGHGITDPTIPFEEVTTALPITEAADDNTIAALAREFIAKYK